MTFAAKEPSRAESADGPEAVCLSANASDTAPNFAPDHAEILRNPHAVREAALAGVGSPSRPRRLLPMPGRHETLHQVRLKYLALRLHPLEPKPFFHFLHEVERGANLRAHLEKYAALPADFIKANGGGQFGPRAFLLRTGAPLPRNDRWAA
jgi:hypothetical protein